MSHRANDAIDDRAAELSLRESDARTTAAAVLGRMGIREPRPATGTPTMLGIPRTVVLSPAQLDAAERATRALDSRGGVLLADRTGTGKTFLALALIEHALAAGNRVLIAGPAALAPQWSPLLRKAALAHGSHFLNRRAAMESPGDASAVAWLSHAMLSLGRWPPAVDCCDLVVVDEAHAFRNPSTGRHRSLAWLCRSARVVLITATPVNNSLMDLYFLFRLFIGDGALDDLGVPDLEAAFRAAAEAGGPVRPPLDAAIDALTVRTRTSRHSPGETSPRDGPRVQPIAVRYDRDDDGERMARIIDGLRRLDLSAYAVTPAGRLPAGGELVRFGLVKRLESSIAAFSASARALKAWLEAFADAALAGFWLSPAAHRAFTANDPGQLLLAPLALPRLPPGFDPDRLARAALDDAATLRDMSAGEPTADRKALILSSLLEADLADHKVLVFTEYRDTAVHLWRTLRSRVRVGLIHGSKAMLGEEPAGRLEVVRRFAPLANNVPHDPLERVDVLIATDVLAEGFNLQDAADVVSYDLPWNPVRLIQRIGRIDRAGSPHALVRCHNFIPDRTLDTYLGLVDTIRAKLETIRAGPGRSGLQAPFKGLPGSEGTLRSTLAATSQSMADSASATPPAAAMTRSRRRADSGFQRPRVPSIVRPTTLLRRLGDEDPGLFDEFETAADPTAGLGIPGHDSEPGDPDSNRAWLVALAVGSGPGRLIFVRPEIGGPVVRSDRSRGLRLLDAIRSGRAPATAWVPSAVERFPGTSSDPRLSAAAAAMAALHGIVTGPKAASARRGTMIRRLLWLVTRERGRPDPRLLQRVDRLVAALREGMRVGVEAAVAASIARAAAERKWGPGRTARLVSELESLVDQRRNRSCSGAATDTDPAVIAVFLPGPAPDPDRLAVCGEGGCRRTSLRQTR